MDAIENAEDVWTGSTSRGGRKRRRRSILKSSPSRQALTDLDSNIRDDVEVTNTDIVKRDRGKRRRSSKRVSFANTHEVKEFMKVKDARELGILEVSADESMQARKQAQSGISTGPGHLITGLNTLLTAPIVHHAHMTEVVQDVPRPPGNDKESDGHGLQETAEMRADREMAQFKLVPQRSKEEALEAKKEKPKTLSDFLKSTLRKSDDSSLTPQEELENTVFRSEAEPEQWTVGRTSSCDPSIRYGEGNAKPQKRASLTEEVTQQIYCDNLGLIGPTYTCRIPSWDSSDSTGLHSSGLHNSSIQSNASYVDDTTSALRTNLKEGKDVTRVFSSEDLTANMEMTGCLQLKQGQALSTGETSVSKVKFREQCDVTRVFTSDDFTANMEMTGCLKQSTASSTGGTSVQKKNFREQQDVTRVFSSEDMTSNMEMTGCFQQNQSSTSSLAEASAKMVNLREQQDVTRVFTSEDKTSEMEMTGCFQQKQDNASTLGGASTKRLKLQEQQQDVTRMFTSEDMTSNMDVTRCFQQEESKASFIGGASAQRINMREQRDVTRVFSTEDTTSNMELTTAIQLLHNKPVEHTRVFSQDDHTGRMELTTCMKDDQSSRRTINTEIKEVICGNQSAQLEKTKIYPDDVTDAFMEMTAVGKEKGIQFGQSETRVDLSQPKQKREDSQKNKTVYEEKTIIYPLGATDGGMDMTFCGLNSQENTPGIHAPSEPLRNQCESREKGKTLLSVNGGIQKQSVQPLQLGENGKTDGMPLDGEEQKMHPSDINAPSGGPHVPEDDRTIVCMNASLWGDVDVTECLEAFPESEKAKVKFPPDLNIKSESPKRESSLRIPPDEQNEATEFGDAENPSFLKGLLNKWRAERSVDKEAPQKKEHSTSHLEKGQDGKAGVAVTLSSVENDQEPVKSQDNRDVQARMEMITNSAKKQMNALMSGGMPGIRKGKDGRGVALVDPTITLGDLSVMANQEGPLDSTHIYPSDHMGRRSAFFPSSALKRKSFGVQDTSMNDSVVSNANRPWDSTSKVLEGNQSFKGSAEKIRKALLAVKSKDESLSESKSSKAKVGLFQEKHSEVSDGRIRTGDCQGLDSKYNSKEGEKNNLPKVSGYQKQLKSVDELPSMLLDSTSGMMKYSSMTLNDDLLNSTEQPLVMTGRKYSDVKARLIASVTGDIEQSMGENIEETATYKGTTKKATIKSPESGKSRQTDIANIEQSMGGTIEETATYKGPANRTETKSSHLGKLRQTDSNNTANMEFKESLTVDYKEDLDKQNVVPGNVLPKSSAVNFGVRSGNPAIAERHTKRFEKEDSARMEMINLPSGFIDGKLSSMPGEHTRRVGTEETGKMDMTTCVASNLKSRLDKEKRSSGMALEEHTRRFGNEETGKMEMTTCLTSNLKSRLDKEKRSSGMALEEHTRRFGTEETGKMEMTTCLTSNLNSRLDKEKQSSGMALEEHTRRFGNEETGKMEMTTCLTSNLKSRLDKEKRSSGMALEEHTRRFGNEETGKMEMTTCLTSNLKSRLDKEKRSSGMALEEHTRRFGTEETGKMEMTTCLTSNLNSRLDKEKQSSGMALEEHTRRFGNEETGKMEMTTCLTSNLKSRLDKEKRSSGMALEEHTRRFGNEETGKMEMTTCLTSNLKSRLDKEKRSSGMALEEHTRRFGNEETGKMEMTTCLTSNLKSRLDKEKRSSGMALEEHTRRFGTEETGKMEMTTCLTSNLDSRLDKEKQSSGMALEEHTRRFGNEETGKMEMTTCLTSNLKSRLDKEKRSSGMALEEHTRRFGNEETGKMEMTTCLTSNLKSRLDKEKRSSGMALEEHTRRFGNEETGRMEITTCLTSNLKSGLNNETTASATALDQHTRRFGNEEMGKMEMTTCLTSNLNGGLNKDITLSGTALEENTRRFGNEQTGKMEMTTCLSATFQSGLDKENTPPGTYMNTEVLRQERAIGMEVTIGSADKENTPPSNVASIHALSIDLADKENTPPSNVASIHALNTGLADKENTPPSNVASIHALNTGLADKENTPPSNVAIVHALSNIATQEEQTVRFGKEDDAGMEMTTSLTSNLQSVLDKENVAPRVVPNISSADSFGVSGGLAFAGGQQAKARENWSAPPVNSIPKSIGNVPDEPTRRFGNEDIAGMEMTTCVTSNLQGGMDKENEIPVKVSHNPEMSSLFASEECTRRFERDDCAGMEFTSCVTAKFQSDLGRRNAPLTTSSKLRTVSLDRQSTYADEEHTRKFKGGDAAGMEITSCLTTRLQDGNSDRPVGSASDDKSATGVPEEQTKRFGNGDNARMEMTNCLTSNLQSKLDRECASPGNDHNSSEGHTKRFQTGDKLGDTGTGHCRSEDTVKMELASCLQSQSQKREGYAVNHEEQIKYFSSGGPAEMETTSRLPRMSRGAENKENIALSTLMCDTSVVTPPLVIASEDQRKNLGSEIQKGESVITTDHNQSQHRQGKFDDVTRRFGSEETGKMELTSCAALSEGDDVACKSTLAGGVSAQQLPQEQEKTRLFQEGMTERMDLTNIDLRTESSQNEFGGPPPCKKSKPNTGNAEGTSYQDIIQSKVGTETSDASSGVYRSQKTEDDGIKDVANIEMTEPKINVEGAPGSQVVSHREGDSEGVKEGTEVERSAGRKKRDSDTFTLETGTMLVPHIDEISAGPLKAVGTNKGEETSQKVLPLWELQFPAGIWDTEGIMEEEEFQSPECTEDLEDLKPVMWDSRAAHDRSLPLSAPDALQEPTSTVDPSAGSGINLIPEDLTVDQFLGRFLSKGGFADTKACRETMVPTDLKKPEEVEDFLKVIFITKPNQDINEWALQHLETNLSKFKAILSQKSQLLKDRFREIFLKLRGQNSRQVTHDALLQSHKNCTLASQKELQEWNYKVISQLTEHLQYGLKKMGPKVETSSEGLTVIDERMEAVDQKMSEIDDAIASLQDTIMPSEEEMNLYEDNNKRLSDWTNESEQQQDTVKQLEKEKLNLKRRKEEQTQQIKGLEAAVSDLDAVDSEETINNRKEEMDDLKDKLEVLQSMTEWELKGASASFDKLHFTFLFGTMDLKVEYEKESDCPTKLKSLSLESFLAEPACPIAKLTHRLVLQWVDVDKLKGLYGTNSTLPVMLQVISGKVIKARHLEEELRQVDDDHLFTIEDFCVHMVFSSVKAHTKFVVTFDLNSSSSGDLTATASHKVGISKLDDVQKILEKMKPGSRQLTKTAAELDKLLETPSEPTS